MKTLFSFSFLLLLASSLQAQGLKGLIKKATGDSTASLPSLSGVRSGSAKLSHDEIIAGLREALTVGVDKGTKRVSLADGFFKDAAIKILMPKEAQQVEQKLRALGMGRQVDEAILSMNRAAEDAAAGAAVIFRDAILGMTVTDGLSILKGGEGAATAYLQERTTASLLQRFRPAVERSLEKVQATRYWNSLFTTYNRFSREKVNTDLAAYVTEKAVAGIFQQVRLEEQQIRKNPAARTTALLKKVFE